MRVPGWEFAAAKSTHMKAKLMCRECCGALPLQLMGMCFFYLHKHRRGTSVPGYVCMGQEYPFRKGVIV